MKTRHSKLARWTACSLLSAWGLFSFILLCCEYETGSLSDFITLKVLSLASLMGCLAVTKRLVKNGTIPEPKED